MNIFPYFQSDQWKLILALTLSLGLGLSCCLLVCILRLCRLYSDKVTQPRASEGEMNQRQKIDLDSESVLDYDINTALYTPLPEPRIMLVGTNQRPAFWSRDQPQPIRSLHFRCQEHHHHRRSPGSTR